MRHVLPAVEVITAPLDIADLAAGERGLAPSPTCPLCHTVDHTITGEVLVAGGAWRCGRCGQMWDAERLATAAAYAAS